MIPLPNVPGKILSKVIEYCKFHVDAQKTVDNKPAKTEDEVKQWDTEFVKVDQATLFDLILVSLVLDRTGQGRAGQQEAALLAHMLLSATATTIGIHVPVSVETSTLSCHTLLHWAAQQVLAPCVCGSQCIVLLHKPHGLHTCSAFLFPPWFLHAISLPAKPASRLLAHKATHRCPFALTARTCV